MWQCCFASNQRHYNEVASTLPRPCVGVFYFSHPFQRTSRPGHGAQLLCQFTVSPVLPCTRRWTPEIFLCSWKFADACFVHVLVRTVSAPTISTIPRVSLASPCLCSPFPFLRQITVRDTRKINMFLVFVPSVCLTSSPGACGSDNSKTPVAVWKTGVHLPYCICRPPLGMRGDSPLR